MASIYRLSEVDSSRSVNLAFSDVADDLFNAIPPLDPVVQQVQSLGIQILGAQSSLFDGWINELS